MVIAELKVELTGVSDVLVNGVNALDSRGKHRLEEKEFLKALTPEQQHMVICEVRQMLARMVDAHRRRQAAVGAITAEDFERLKKSRIRSGAGGVRGTDIGPLLPGS
jgi:hypothetical protein